MEPPQKRLRVDPSPPSDDDDEEDQDELSLTPAQFEVTQDPMYELDKGRAKAATRLKSAFEDIFEKYGKDFTGADDVINFYTDEIEVDNGHVQSLTTDQDDDVSDDSASSDEESRILNGKSKDRKEKSSSSKSLVPANSVNFTPTPQFGPSWNDPFSAAPYRISSLAFSSPSYGANPPFNFGPVFGNGPTDPMWATPELPIQTPHYPYGPRMGFGGGGAYPGMFGGQSNYVYKRVNAKAFRQLAAPSKRAESDAAGEGDEEDEILLGRNKAEKSVVPNSGSAENSLVLRESRASSSNSSRNTDQQPPFRGLDTPSNEQENSPDRADSNAAQARVTKVKIGEFKSAIPYRPAKPETRQRPKLGRPKLGRPKLGSSPGSSHRKKNRSKQTSPAKPAPDSNQAPKDEPRQLKPNERRIEVIIPLMRDIFPTGIPDITKEVEEVHHDTPIEVGVEPTTPNNRPRSSQSTGGLLDVLIRPIPLSAGPAANLRSVDKKKEAPQITDTPEQVSSPSKEENNQLRRSTRIRKLTYASFDFTLTHGEDSPESVASEASQEFEDSSQTEVNSSTNDSAASSPGETEQTSCDEEETLQMALDQQLSAMEIEDTGVNEDGVALSPCSDESTMPELVVESENEDVSIQPSSPVDKAYESTAYSTSVFDPISTEEAISEAPMTPEESDESGDEDENEDEEPSRVDESDAENASTRSSHSPEESSESTDDTSDDIPESASTEEEDVAEAVIPQELDESQADDEEILDAEPAGIEEETPEAIISDDSNGSQADQEEEIPEESVLVDGDDTEEMSIQSPPVPEETRKSINHGAHKSFDFTLDEFTVEEASPEEIMTEQPDDSETIDEELPGTEPARSPIALHEGTRTISMHLLENSKSPHHDLMLDDMVSNSELPGTYETPIVIPEDDLQCPSPQLPAIRETPDSDVYLGQGYLSPTLEALGATCEEEDRASDQPSFSDVPYIDIDDDSPLDTGYQYAVRSPSLGALESPNQDPFSFPQFTTATLALRFLPPPAESEIQNTMDVEPPAEPGIDIQNRQANTTTTTTTTTNRFPSPELGTPIRPEKTTNTIIPRSGKRSPTSESPTKKRCTSRIGKSRSTHPRTPSKKRFPLTSLIPDGLDDDENDNHEEPTSFFSSTSFSHANSNTNTNTNTNNNNNNETPSLPPLLSTPRTQPQTQTPKSRPRHNLPHNLPPATDSRAPQSLSRRKQKRSRPHRAVHSSPLGHRAVAERLLLSSPTKRSRLGTMKKPARSPVLSSSAISIALSSPRGTGTPRPCGVDGFVCGRAFCLTCCV